ncbi:TetR/AcrR family transcriptional regulator [Aeromicrobium sp. SMF47]|uniref:TetR/AcrR family transcriptional regulator n=1 Tax=Aeromicrobium yanjiei TaxID=2662028 RepID=A0A5Q2MP47_9ACTN|nr:MULTISPECIES: TetR/AcrR family transcriptional regulator [Aeromicrobium]MRJ75737.1 TetR/AcrR family transcriptional regulator [Aeromicrobium yanjiei]MRK00081.1 TetR/AcrR family transcriptional regulator [Aeromicrobium sp. S22]QGG43012.1 TetR/AcrR family transcriptional regulator [Aeromicrobium yanjiei]
MAVKAGQYRGMTAEQRHADRRARLLEATLQVWGRDGGPTVTMTRICAEAGLTERYFYQCFSGLDDALKAVMDDIAAQIAERAVAAVEQTAGGPTERVRAGIGAFVEILTDDPRKGRVAIVESMSLDALRPHRARLLRQFAELAQHEARELYGPQAWSQEEGRLAATMFIGGVAELVTAWIEGTLETSPGDIVEAATHHFTVTAHR